jgi:hypothetical protein
VDLFLERLLIWIATWRDTVPPWYLGCEYCVACARQKNLRRSEKLLSKSESVCSGFGDTISYVGVEQNPGPGVEGESFMQVMCSGCDRILKSGSQNDTCGRWFITAEEKLRLNW